MLLLKTAPNRKPMPSASNPQRVAVACQRPEVRALTVWRPGRIFDFRSATSAGRCKPLTSLRIIVRLKGRRPLRTSETLLLLPMYGIKSLGFSPSCSIRNRRAAMASGGSIGYAFSS